MSAHKTMEAKTNSTPTDTDQLQWFVCQCNPTRMVHSVKNLLDKLAIPYYMALHTVMRQHGETLLEVQESYLGHFFFVKSTLRDALKFKFANGLDFTYVRNHRKQLLTVPESQMNDFIRVIETMQDKINFAADYYAVGDHVIVTKGKLCGVTGTLVQVNAHDHLLLRIHGVTAISVRIGKSYLKKIG